jgi:hypothetical protein
MKRIRDMFMMSLLLALLLIGSGVSQRNVQASDPFARIEGTVVAYSPFSRLTILVGPPDLTPKRSFHEHILLRLEDDGAGLRKGQLVQLRYNDETGAKPELPKAMFEQNGRWSFEATRDDSCTSTLEAVLYYKVNDHLYDNMRYTSWTEPLKSPLTTTVPCYVVTSGGFSKL